VRVSGRTSLSDFFGALYKNRNLLKQLIFREIAGRYRGSVLGIAWSFINPLVMLAVYTVVFGYIFPSRWDRSGQSLQSFALVLFSGLIVFNFFSECVSRAPSLILNNTNYVKKVVFPLEILPWVSLGVALFHFLIGLVVVVAFNLIVHHTVNWTVLLLPILLLPFSLCITGFSWLLAALGVFLRDIGQVIGLALSVLMFLSPLFYPITAIPERFRYLLYFNPVTYVIEQARGLILWGDIPDLSLLAAYSLICAIVSYLGFYFFQRARGGFADVL
jgi:lipopolysaccharide transport system permease protein